MDKLSNLSPVQELSDLSFILSQLSSVSGDISEKTLEELLRDCENNIPNGCFGTEHLYREQKNEQIRKEPERATQPAQSSSNMFKSAIDSLSEISHLVQEKLALSEKPAEVSSYPKPIREKSNIEKSQSGSSYRSNRTAVIRRDHSQAIAKRTLSTCSSEPSLHQLTERQSNKSLTSMSSARAAITPRTGLKRIPSRQSTISAAMKLYGKPKLNHSNVQAKVSSSLFVRRDVIAANKSIRTLTKRLPANRELDSGGHKISTGRLAQISRTAKTSKARAVGNNESSQNSQTCTKIQEKYKLTAGTLSTPTRLNKETATLEHNAASGSETFRLSDNVDQFTAVTNDLRSFENKLTAIEKQYKEQLEELTKKCDALQRQQFVRNACSKESHSKLLLDVCVQTELKTNETGCGTDENIPALVLDDKVVMPKMELNDLTQDLDAVPEKLPKRMSFISSNKKNCNKLYSTASEKCQLNIIRSLQLELDSVKKSNMRLTSQLATCNKMRLSERSRFGIKRTVSTQTTSVQDSTIFREENVVLKDRIKILEKEINALQEKRQLDLHILQSKHEEEIQVLLEENLSLSKQLDPFHTWRSW